MISDNKESKSTSLIPKCTLNTEWNAYLCEQDSIGMLLIDSLDDDRMSRQAEPIYVTNQ